MEGPPIRASVSDKGGPLLGPEPQKLQRANLLLAQYGLSQEQVLTRAGAYSYCPPFVDASGSDACDDLLAIKYLALVSCGAFAMPPWHHRQSRGRAPDS